MSRDRFTMYVGNVDERATESLLYELFMQAGPVTSVRIPSFNGKNKNFAFVEFKHALSVPYTIQLMGGLELFGRPLNLQARGGNHRGVEPIPFPSQCVARYRSFESARQGLEDAKSLNKPGGKRHYQRDNSMMPAVKSRRKSDSPDRGHHNLDHIPDNLILGPGFLYPSQGQPGRDAGSRYQSRDDDGVSGRRGEDRYNHHHHHHHHHHRNRQNNRHNNQSSRGFQKDRNNTRHNHRRKH